MDFIENELHLIVHGDSSIIYRTTTKAFFTVFYKEHRSFGTRIFKRKKYKCIYNYLIDLIYLPIVVKTLTERIVSYNKGHKGKLKTGDIDLLVLFLDKLNKEVLNGNLNLFTKIDGWELLQTKRGYSYDTDKRTRFVLQSMRIKGNESNIDSLISSISLSENANTLFVYAPTLTVEEVWEYGLKPEHLEQGVRMITKDSKPNRNCLPNKYGSKQSITDVLFVLPITTNHLKNETRLYKLIKNYIFENSFITTTITKQ